MYVPNLRPVSMGILPQCNFILSMLRENKQIKLFMQLPKEHLENFMLGFHRQILQQPALAINNFPASKYCCRFTAKFVHFRMLL